MVSAMLTGEARKTAVDEVIGPWEPWDPDLDGYQSVARYVSTEALINTGLESPVTVAGVGHTSAQLTAAVEAIYRKLEEKELRYNQPPWQPWRSERGQVIRHAQWATRDSATCLDLAIIFAAQSMQAGLKPLIALAQSRGDTPDHAFALIPPKSSWQATVSELHDQQWRTVPSTHGTVLVRDTSTEPGGVACPDGFLMVDPSVACRGNRGSRGLDTAREAGRLALANDEYVRFVLVGIDAVWDEYRDQYEPLVPPDSRFEPGVHGWLPAIESPAPYGSRRRQFDRLKDKFGTVVLIGESGRGKSTLALRLAQAAVGGCGWFLTATDRQVLLAEMAGAEMAEIGLTPDGMDSEDIRGAAVKARNRLNTATGPWTVVLDNANLPPERIHQYLPTPDPRRAQLLVITTTDENWCDYHSNGEPVRVVRLPELEAQEALDDLGCQVQAGSPWLNPVFTSVVGQLRALPDAPVNITAHTLNAVTTQSGAAEQCWAWIKLALTGNDRAVRLARLAAWMPPDQIPLVAYRDLLAPESGQTDPTAISPARALAETGLCVLDGDRQSIHRLMAAAVRADHNDTRDDRPHPLVELLADPRTRAAFESSIDQLMLDTTDTELTALAINAQAAGVRQRQLGLALYALAQTYELREQATNARRIYELSDGQLDQANPGDGPLIAAGLAAQARVKKNNSRNCTIPEFLAAMDQCQLAEELCQPLIQTGDIPAISAAGNALAMKALLLACVAEKLFEGQDLTNNESDGLKQFGIVDDDPHNLYNTAFEWLQQSHTRREEVLDPDSIALDRSLYNPAFVQIRLANAVDPSDVEHWLDEAEHTLQRVFARRNARYSGQPDHPYLAAVQNGLAIVRYIRAVRIPGASKRERLEWLGQATDLAIQALETRSSLPTGNNGEDSGEATKSGKLVAKILYARARLAIDDTKRVPARDSDQDFLDALKDFEGMDGSVSELLATWQQAHGDKP